MFESNQSSAQALTHALAQVAEAASKVNELIAQDALLECTDQGVLEFTEQLSRVIDHVRAAESVFIARVDRSGITKACGHLTTAAWLRNGLGWDRRRSASTLRTARLLSHTYHSTREAWLAGSITQAHADAISHGLAKAVKHVDRRVRDEARAQGEELLLSISQQYSPDHTVAAVRRIIAAADPDGLNAAAVEADAQQWVKLTHVGDGWVLRGWLDNLNGAALATVFEGRRNSLFHGGELEITPPAGASTASDDQVELSVEVRGTAEISDELAAERMSQANARILGELAHELLNDGGAGVIGGERPHVEISVTLAELRAGNGFGELSIPASNTSVPTAMDTIRQLSCDAHVRRVVTSGTYVDVDTGNSCDAAIARLIAAPSEILDYGRSERIVPPGLRRRLIRRDNGCVFPMCTRPASYTHAHHVQHWSADGATDLRNLALVCNRHHTALHHDGWQLQPRSGRQPHQPGYWQVLPPVMTTAGASGRRDQHLP